MRRLIIALFVAGAIAAVAAQEAAPTFEVASVKQNTSGDGAQFIRMMPGNRLSATNMPVRALIMLSYQLQQFQLVGGPAWLASDHYDIIAKLAGEAKPFVPGQENPTVLAIRS